MTMKVPVLNMSGSEVGSVELPPEIFAAKINTGLMHQALVRQMANGRLGTHNSQTRGQVSLTTAKAYRQKGTGNARHGSRRAPIFVGGGVAHGPHSRSYRKRMPRKMRRAAMRSALSAKVLAEGIIVLDDLHMDEPKTRRMAEIVEGLTAGRSALILLADADRNVELSARNLSNVKTLRASYLNIRDLLGHDRVLIPLSALDVISSQLGGGASAGGTEEEE
jgi:large subunit ribosomal protein L4